MFTVRLAVRTDMTALDGMFARSYPRLLKHDYAPSVLVTALPIISRAQPRLVTSGTFFVVEEAVDGIIGAGGWTTAGPGTGNIRHVVTDDRQVRRGVGRALMEHVFASARAAGVQRLDCMSTITAVPFYQAMGLAVIGPINVPLAPGIDFPAVAMWRGL